MGAATVAALRAAVSDPATVARYWDHVQLGGGSSCWYWTGAVSGRGHGRFQLGDTYVAHGGTRRRVTHVVIAHRFGYALRHGVDRLLRVAVLAHRCDNPLCQRPEHWRESDPSSNRREYFARRREILGPLADARGARGRARAVRDALRRGDDLDAVILAGASEMHRNQLVLLADLPRRYDVDTFGTVTAPRHEEGVSEDEDGQLGLFDVD